MTFPPVLTTTVSRVLYGLPMIVFGMLHFMNSQMMSGMVPGFIPGGVFWVYLTGIALIAAGVAIIANRRFGRLAAVLLGVLLLSFALTIHLPAGMDAMPNLLKDTSLAGAAFAFAGILKE